MNWGKKIILVYAIFILGIASLVFISMRQNIDLVTDNYYEKELKYQEQIDKKKRTQSLKESIMITKINSDLHISFPSDAIPKSGEVTFYRPSDDSEDKIFLLKENEKEQIISLNNFSSGLWKVVIYWRTNGTEYLNEEIFYN
ncbi:MAG TPA: FixH family protein [Ignavibacteria bacterium]|nr:FixH family protein [Ignavibacteria bacterium]